MRKLELDKIKRYLKNKKIIFAAWNVERKDDNPYQNWYLPLKDLFGETIIFDTAKNYFRYGKILMNKKLLNLVEKEKPDYVFFLIIYDEIDILALQEIKKKNPRIITLNMFTDDDWRYEDFSRFYSLFIDYPIVNITDVDMKSPYIKDGIKKLSLSFGMNCQLFRPIKIKKRYDVSFVGRPNKNRVSLVKFLLDNNIDINVWGDGWENYPQIMKAYRGRLPGEDLVKVNNESKINLGFTIGGYNKLQIKGRVLEIAACKSFCLLEYFSAYLKYFKEEKELVMFKNKNDLMKKIKYFLKNEKYREKIAIAAYERTIRFYNKSLELLDYFKDIKKFEKNLMRKNLPSVIGVVETISLDDIKRGDEFLRNKISEADYIIFEKTGNKIDHPFRNYLQQYSLEKSGKEISCCDYYVSSKDLGNYLLFKARVAFATLKKKDFDSCLKIEQIMTTKQYFLNNLNKFKFALNQGKFELINDKNTTYLSIPLVSIEKAPTLNYEVFKRAFQMKFLDNLYSLYYQNKIFSSKYLYRLIFSSIFYNRFLLRIIRENLSDKKKVFKLKKGI